jgi:hypothetical protein
VITKIFFKVLPWLLIIALVSVLWWQNKSTKEKEPQRTINHLTILEKMESMGSLEVLRYQYADVLEYREKGKQNEFLRGFLKSMRMDPDSKAVLITKGEVVICVDLQQIKATDILISQDTLVVYLPSPQICQVKLDLQKTKLYALETGYFANANQFVEGAYKQAENHLFEVAQKSNWETEGEKSAAAVLVPLLEMLSNRPVDLRFKKEIGNLEETNLLNHGLR